MHYLIDIKTVILEDENKVVSYSLLIACFLVLITASLVVIRIDKLRLVLKFIVLFFKEDTKGNDIGSL